MRTTYTTGQWPCGGGWWAFAHGSGGGEGQGTGETEFEARREALADLEMYRPPGERRTWTMGERVEAERRRVVLRRLLRRLNRFFADDRAVLVPVATSGVWPRYGFDLPSELAELDQVVDQVVDQVAPAQLDQVACKGRDERGLSCGDEGCDACYPTAEPEQACECCLCAERRHRALRFGLACQTDPRLCRTMEGVWFVDRRGAGIITCSCGASACPTCGPHEVPRW